MLTVITFILAAGVICAVAWVIYRSDKLDEREDELAKYSVHLDERANKLSADEETVRMLNLQLRQALEEQKRKEAEMVSNEQAVAEAKEKIARNTEERYNVVLQAAEEATGWRLSTSRTAENSTIRTFISYHMHNEGFSYESIGRVMHRNHSTITHLVRKMEDMLSLPQMYKPELDMYNKMVELL